MTTQTNNIEKDVVRNLRKIRDEISSEINDMTFEQERAYLDKLLAGKDKSEANNRVDKKPADNIKLDN